MGEPLENEEGGRWFRLSALNTPSVICVVNVSYVWLLWETLAVEDCRSRGLLLTCSRYVLSIV